MARKLSFLLGLVAASALSLQAATVSGVVKEGDSTGTVVQGAIVTLSSGGGGFQQLLDTTDAAGAYSFANVALGNRQVRASKAGFITSAQVPVNITDSTATYTANINLISSSIKAKVSGVITDTASAEPLNGVQVIIRSGNHRDTILTGATGAYSFDSIPSGTFSLTASIKGYSSKTVNSSVTGATVPAVNIQLKAIQFAKITGTVTDSISGAALKGALVVLRSGDSRDSVITGETGAYTVDSVQTGSFTVTVSLSGYVSRSVSGTVDATTPAALNVKLAEISYGKLFGKVTSDSLKGAALAGVELILSVRNGAGGNYTAVDTTTSLADGSYLFEKVQSSQNYRVAGTLTGYTSGSVLHNNQTAGIDTVNLALVKIGTGTLLVEVFKKVDSTAIAGASIVAVSSGTGAGTTITGTSGATGIVILDKIEITGTKVSFSVTVSASGYIAGSASASVPKNGVDTVKLYLLAVTTGSKMLSGVVKDSTTKAVLANARIVLTINGAGAGSAQLTFIDTADEAGKYSFSGIPISSTKGTVTATLSSYRTFTGNNVQLGAANKVDTTVLNITLLKSASAVLYTINGLRGSPEFNLLQSGILQLSNFKTAGTIKIFGINGKLIYRKAFNQFTGAITLPSNMAVRGNSYVICISQDNEIYRKQIIVP